MHAGRLRDMGTGWQGGDAPSGPPGFVGHGALARNDMAGYPIAVDVKHLTEAEAECWPNNAHTLLPDGSTRDEPGTNTCGSIKDDGYRTTFRKSGREGKIEKIRARYVLGDGMRNLNCVPLMA
jgi:hypothetical protein